MMKSIFTLFMALFIFMGNPFAKKVDVDEAQKAALGFIRHLDHLQKIPSSLDLIYTAGESDSPFALDKQMNTPYYYVFNFSDEDGYIIVSADDAVVPVLAYSTQQDYQKENQPDAFVKWMDKYSREIKEIITKQMPASRDIEQKWNRLLSGLPINTDRNAEAVNPLLASTWDQMANYHELCPYDDDYNNYVATGCVATAMAQVMKYHQYPQNGEGYHTYNHSKYGSLSANFGSQSYDWSSMPNQVTSPNNAVATLMYHCGVSLEMNYGPAQTGGSSTNSLDVVANALKSYFSYSSSTQFTMRENYSDANWKNLLKTELNNNRPMEYGGVGQGGGHAFVCDGYDNNDYFHFNWGWSGQYDGYFYLDNLNPGTGGTGAGASNYNQYQQLVYGIEAETGGGGGGTTPPGEGSPLELYSNIYISPSPIDFYTPFTVSISILNNSGTNYIGDLTAAIFNEEGANVGFVQTYSNVMLETGYYYDVDFSTDGLPVTPGYYTIGIYSKKSGEEWASLKEGNYTNNVTVNISGPANNIQLYSEAQINPRPIIQGEALTVDVNIANLGSYFSGVVSADLYNSQGEYEELIQEVNMDLEGGYFIGESFQTSSVNLDPGTYIIAFWEKANGGSWQLVGSTNEFPNPITVNIVAPEIQEDPYENNDSEANAYAFNAANGGQGLTLGSNNHVGTDYDYYEYILDPAFKYGIHARVHDSYNSGNGNSYTNDVVFSYNQGSGAGEIFDTESPEEFMVNGQYSIKFFVAPYFSGQTGTYLLDVTIVKKGPAGIEDMQARDAIHVYPNPARDILYLELENYQDLNIQEAIIYNAFGQSVLAINLAELSSDKTDIDVSTLESGVYFLRLKDEEGILTHKFNILR